MVTDASGTVVGEQRYYPYGETRVPTGSMFTNKLFTGQREVTGLGIYHYGARFYSPKLGRFISADSIVPNPANPQDLNRFSYVLNNPLRYTDPTGHKCVSEGPGDCLSNGRPINGAGGGNGSSGGGGGGGNNDDDPVPDPNPNGVVPPFNPIDAYCGNISGLACTANAAQDIATLIDLVGVGLIEMPVVGAGCLEGGPLGCALGEFATWGTWNTTLNNAETIASGLSFVFTLGDDLLNNGGWGENSATSLTTLIAGQLPLSPSWDLAVDTYSSGYNHGFFNGIYTFGSNGLLKP